MTWIGFKQLINICLATVRFVATYSVSSLFVYIAGERWPTCWWRHATTISVVSGRRLCCLTTVWLTVIRWMCWTHSCWVPSSTRRDFYNDFTTYGLTLSLSLLFISLIPFAIISIQLPMSKISSVTVIKVKAQISPQWKSILEVPGVACHIRPHNDTNTPRLSPSQWRLVLSLPTLEGWKAELTLEMPWLGPCWESNPWPLGRKFDTSEPPRRCKRIISFLTCHRPYW